MNELETNNWNNRVLRSKGVNERAIAPGVVRSVGDAKRATLHDETVVERTEHIFVEGYGLIKTAPYELHFIFETPVTMRGWKYYCTCGSIAGVVGLNAYSKLAAPTSTGHMLVCIRHTTLKQNEGIGRHADNSTE